MARLFVTATGTGVGKTYATGLLVEAFARLGLRPGACKPVETGVSDEPADAAALLERAAASNPRFAHVTPRDLTAYTFPLPAAPFCADTEGVIRIETILYRIGELESRCDILLVEGAGGLMVPLTKESRMIDLIRTLECPALLVTPSQLGCINDTLLSLEALERRGIPHEWCVNRRERDRFDTLTRPFYDARFPGSWWELEEGIDAYARRIAAELGVQ